MHSKNQDHNLSEEISRRAYEIWEAEGRPHGRDAEHWLAAEQDVRQADGAAPAAAKTADPKPARKTTKTADTDKPAKAATTAAAKRSSAKKASTDDPTPDPPAPKTGRSRKTAPASDAGASSKAGASSGSGAAKAPAKSTRSKAKNQSNDNMAVE